MQYQTPAHIAPTFDQHHRPVHPAPPAMTPSRPQMAPAPNVAPLPPPPPQANSAHVYNVPRAPEVYTLADPIDAAIPADVREQFQRDDQGRVLFFTAPPLHRPHNGVAEQYAGLGHSVRHLSSIKQLREERARKRKERDEAEALEREKAAAAANNNKKIALMEDANGEEEKENQQQQVKSLEDFLLGWAAEMDRGTKVLDAAIGGFENWDRMMQEGRETAKGMSKEDRRVSNLQWYADYMVEKGKFTEEQRRDFVDCFIRRAYLKE